MTTKGVHRLVDMLVEEVSLVDRAANKQRFLLVKRDDQMSMQKNEGQGAEATPDAAVTEEPKQDTAPEQGQGETAKAEDNELLATAMSALDVLSGIVEEMGQAGGGEGSKGKLVELATALGEIAQAIVGQSGEQPPPEEAPVEQSADGAPAVDPPVEDADKAFNEKIEQTKALLGKFSDLLKGAGSVVAKQDAPTGAQVEQIGVAVKKYESALAECQQRISKMEKAIGAPASSTTETVSKSHPADSVSWPADLNAPTKTRESA